MIKRCLVHSEDGFHKYQGYYIHGGVIFNVTTESGNVQKYSTKYDPNRHELLEDSRFERIMNTWKDFLAIVRKGYGPCFAKSVVWKECVEARMLFNTYTNYNHHIDYMLKLNVLTHDGRYLRIGTPP